MQEVPVNKSLDQGAINPALGCYVSLVSLAPDGSYTYSDAHQFYSSISSVIGTPQMISSAAVAGRIFSGDGVVFTNVSGTKIGAIVIARQNAGASSTWRLVLYEDTGIVGVPLVPSGGNIIVTWNVQGIFGL